MSKRYKEEDENEEEEEEVSRGQLRGSQKPFKNKMQTEKDIKISSRITSSCVDVDENESILLNFHQTWYL